MTPADVYRAFLPGYDNYVRQTFGNSYPALTAAQQTAAMTALQTGKALDPDRRDDGIRELGLLLDVPAERARGDARRPVLRREQEHGRLEVGRVPGRPDAPRRPLPQLHLHQQDVSVRGQAAAAHAEVREERRRVGCRRDRLQDSRRMPTPTSRWEGCSRGEQEGRRRDRRSRLGRRHHRRRADQGRADGGRASSAATTAARNSSRTTTTSCGTRSATISSRTPPTRRGRSGTT